MSKPWENEPDGLVWESSGLYCELRRGPARHWCGYVGVTTDHPLYGKDYSDIVPELENLLEKRLKEPLSDTHSYPLLVNCLLGIEPDMRMDIALGVHGGVTYTGTGIPEQGWGKEGLWLIGFDCNHACDLAPAYVDTGLSYGVYRTFEYAKAETEKLANQVKEIFFKGV